MNPLLETLKARFPEAVLSVHDDTVRGELSARVAADRIVEVMTFLHDDPGMAFDHITDVCSADYPDDPERFEVIYHLLSLPHGTRLRIKARLTEE
ncbi:MAG TPA: NADH-quinone oxidoreductase subunit C, partial [Candidatus Udaeobacter sp.]|nr:NADH-quinone oxidoreductase subunit C [Candidatus Udaeobacter sp.]